MEREKEQMMLVRFTFVLGVVLVVAVHAPDNVGGIVVIILSAENLGVGLDCLFLQRGNKIGRASCRERV